MSLDKVFFALSDGTRRSILEKLKDVDMTVMQLADCYDMSFQAISKHLKVLDHAGLITKKKEGRKYLCSQKSSSLSLAILWISSQHEFWKSSFDSLEEFLDGSTGKKI